MILPPHLRKGDSIVIIATARKISRDELAPAISILEEFGLEVILSPNLFGSSNQFSGTDAERAADLQWALDHPHANAIIVARGGYGTMRVIDLVTFSGITNNPKWMVGFSDVTVLHSHLTKLGIGSIHGPMPITFNRSAASNTTLLNALTGIPIKYEWPWHPLNRNGFVQAPITGGNLSVLYALSGSVSEDNFEGKILFLEDLDEYLYHIDRMMMQLKRAGKLANLAGLVVGEMSEMKDNPVPFGRSAEEIIRAAVDEYNYPVCFGFPAGHGQVNNAFYMGAVASIDVQPETVSFVQ
jgi:muramoyltetrapeptide carboxypeptidase